MENAMDPRHAPPSTPTTHDAARRSGTHAAARHDRRDHHLQRPWRRPVRRPRLPERPGDDVADSWLRARPLWLRSPLAAVGAAAVSAGLILTGAFLGWLAAAYSTGTGGQASATGLSLWLLAHGVPLDAGFGPLSLVPWLLTVLPLACCVWGAHWVISTLPEKPGRRLPNLGGLRQDVAVALATYALGYTLAAMFFALLARASAVTPAWPAPVLLPAVIAILGFIEALRYDAGAHLGAVAPRAARGIRARLPVWFGASMRAGAWTALSVVVAGLLTVLVLVPARWGRITAIFHTLHTGFIGGVLVVLATLVYLGTAAMWVASFLAGPGFTLGAGSSVTLAEVVPGQVPPMPLLGILPEPGALPGAMWALTLLPVLAGALGGYLAARRLAALSPWRLKAGAAVTSAVCAAGLLTVLAGLSSGSLGSGRLSSVGIPLGWFALAVTGELVVGALLAATAVHRVRVPRV